MPETRTSSSFGGSCMTSPGVKQRSRGLLARDHEMAEPGREPVPGIVLHGAQLGRRAERIGDAPRRALVVGGEGDADVAVVEDGVVRAHKPFRSG